MYLKEQKDLLANSLLRNIGLNSDKLPDMSLTGFMAAKGVDYTGELMIVGRAVNGWGTGFTPHDLNDPDSRSNYANIIKDSVNAENLTECPMQWVTDSWGNSNVEYNPKRSAFWRTVYRVLQELMIADQDDLKWPSKLVWSNLYKISPESGGNPNDMLCSIQFDDCVKLIQMELRAFNPKRVLFLTGNNWFDGFLDLEKVSTAPNYLYVENFGHFNGSKCVVAAHPQGKNEDLWVHEVVSAFDNL